jgi:hypothetical protein
LSSIDLSSVAEWAGVAVVVVVCLVSVVMAALRLPGTWLIVATAGVFGWATGWNSISGGTIILLTIAAVVAELAELLASAVTVRHAGASRRASWGSLIGGFLGMIFLSFLVPIPLLGTIVGALLGCIAGAVIAEMSTGRALDQGTKVGMFSALGFALGSAAKTAIAVAMCGIVLIAILFSEKPTPPTTAEAQATPTNTTVQSVPGY